MLPGRTLFTVVIEVLVLSIAIFVTNIMKLWKVSDLYSLVWKVKWEKLGSNLWCHGVFFFFLILKLSIWPKMQKAFKLLYKYIRRCLLSSICDSVLKHCCWEGISQVDIIWIDLLLKALK